MLLSRKEHVFRIPVGIGRKPQVRRCRATALPLKWGSAVVNDECKIGDTKAELHGFIMDKHGLQ